MSDNAPVAPEAAPSVASPETAIPAEAKTPEAASPPEGAQENQPEQSGETSEKPEKPKRPASERIGELYGRMKSAERERDLALAEVQRLRQPMVDPQRYEAMSFDEQQALQVRQAVRQERAEELAQTAEFREQEAARVRGEMFKQRLVEAAETIPDIDKVITDPTLPVSTIGARFIQESDKGPQVAYWLSQNRAEAARIAALDPYTQAFELGKLEARVSSAPAARKVSQAPAPVPRVAGGANAGAKDPSTMSMSEYAEWFRKRSA
jgi:hypothetical protein